MGKEDWGLLAIIGMTLGIVGLVLIAVGLMGLSYPLACPITGCPSPTSPAYAGDWEEIYIGYAMNLSGLIVLGIGFFFTRRKL